MLPLTGINVVFLRIKDLYRNILSKLKILYEQIESRNVVETLHEIKSFHIIMNFLVTVKVNVKYFQTYPQNPHLFKKILCIRI